MANEAFGSSDIMVGMGSGPADIDLVAAGGIDLAEVAPDLMSRDGVHPMAVRVAGALKGSGMVTNAKVIANPPWTGTQINAGAGSIS